MRYFTIARISHVLSFAVCFAIQPLTPAPKDTPSPNVGECDGQVVERRAPE